jgi:RimJ/RimL family protein N-acetyltransferase
MKLRRATMDDALDVLAWRNDPDSIALSKSGRAIGVKEHLDWFGRNFENPDHPILVAVDDGRKLGMVRFDRAPDEWIVSINLAPAERDKGYGRRALSAGIALHRAAIGPCRLSAEIKDSNLKSLRLFEGLGFVRQELRDGFHYLTRDRKIPS